MNYFHGQEKISSPYLPFIFRLNFLSNWVIKSLVGHAAREENILFPLTAKYPNDLCLGKDPEIIVIISIQFSQPRKFEAKNEGNVIYHTQRDFSLT